MGDAQALPGLCERRYIRQVSADAVGKGGSSGNCGAPGAHQERRRSQSIGYRFTIHLWRCGQRSSQPARAARHRSKSGSKMQANCRAVLWRLHTLLRA